MIIGQFLPFGIGVIRRNRFYWMGSRECQGIGRCLRCVGCDRGHKVVGISRIGVGPFHVVHMGRLR